MRERDRDIMAPSFKGCRHGEEREKKKKEKREKKYKEAHTPR